MGILGQFPLNLRPNNSYLKSENLETGIAFEACPCGVSINQSEVMDHSCCEDESMEDGVRIELK